MKKLTSEQKSIIEGLFSDESGLGIIGIMDSPEVDDLISGTDFEPLVRELNAASHKVLQYMDDENFLDAWLNSGENE